MLYALGIISDKSVQQSEVLTRGEFVTAAVNLVSDGTENASSNVVFADCSSKHSAYAHLMIPVKYGSTQQYQLDKESTILTEYKDIYKTEGTITGNSMTVFSGQDELTEGYVYIDGEKYLTGDTDAEQRLGYSVTAY